MYLDPRAGSKDYIVPLTTIGVPVTERLLDFGDMEIAGRGPDKRPVLVGVEIKKVGDLLTSIRDGRAAEQLRGMARSYEVRWLLIEGYMGPDHSGALSLQERGRFIEARGGFTYQEVAGWLMTMSQTCGVLVKHSASHFESVLWLRALWLWWTAGEWESHRSHLALYEPPMSGLGFEEPSLCQRVAATLPGIGITRARAAAEHFKTAHNMIVADQRQWMEVEGVGKATAARVAAALRLA